MTVNDALPLEAARRASRASHIWALWGAHDKALYKYQLLLLLQDEVLSYCSIPTGLYSSVIQPLKVAFLFTTHTHMSQIMIIVYYTIRFVSHSFR